MKKKKIKKYLPPVVGRYYKVFEWDGLERNPGKKVCYLGTYFVLEVNERQFYGKGSRWSCLVRSKMSLGLYWSIDPRDIVRKKMKRKNEAFERGIELAKKQFLEKVPFLLRNKSREEIYSYAKQNFGYTGSRAALFYDGLKKG